MKKILYTMALVSVLSTLKAQDAPPVQEDDKKTEFDSKFRFGLRITPQPTWFASKNRNDVPSGAVFGFGFGLNLEYWFSNKVCLLTGIGGDFEGGRYTFRNDPSYQATYVLDENDEPVESPNLLQLASRQTAYVLESRRVKTTHVSIPVQLKLSTGEVSGMRYFGIFGGEIGFRTNARANDNYIRNFRQGDSSLIVTSNPEPGTDINIGPQTWFARVGFNAGLGAEYRLDRSTAVFASINYFRSLTNLMRTNSRYTVYAVEGENHRFVKSQLFLTAIRINIGIMF